jgi:transcription initiation factor IIF auxiliary subunit
MKIEIEDYFGNTIVTLDFETSLKTVGITKKVGRVNLIAIEKVVNKHGYNVADLEEHDHMRIQQVNVDDDNERVDLLNLIKDVSDFIL